MFSKFQFGVRNLVQIPLACFFLVLALTQVAWSQGGISAEQVAAIKAATVLVLVDTRDEAASGSGFLIGKDAQFGYIATNEHVVHTETPTRRIQVVFNSGIPGKEAVISADSVAEDPYRDLAILRVSSANLPEPLRLSSPQPVRETMPVWVFGFPFGEMLATSKMHPSMTVTTGTITSLRLNDFGNVTRVQVDADINEGNSGGPIVDASGGLVGIATEKVEDTKIGLGLPPSELLEMLRGRVKESGMHPVSNLNGQATYRSVVVLIDPLQNAKSVSVFFVPQSQAGEIKPGPDGSVGPISPNMREIPLTKTNNEFSGSVTFENPQMTDITYLQQIRLQLGDGQFKWTYPVRVIVPFSKGRQQPAPQTLPGTANDDWLGGPAAPRPGVNGANTNGDVGGKTIEPVEIGRMLLGPAETEAGATYYRLNVGGKVTSTMRWSPDGKSVYLLEESGTLHKVSVPDFREERVLSMGQKASYMTLTKLGLAVGLPTLQEVWLIDANTLQLRKRIPVGSMTGLTGAPMLTKVYAPDQEAALSVIDLESGKVVARRRGSEFHLPAGMPAVRRDGESPGFNFATITPDGKYMMTGGENLNRMRIEGDDFVYEEAGPGGIGQNPQRLEVSPDSLYVAMPSGGGNGRLPNLPGPYNTFVYRISDLQTPVIVVSSGAYPRALSFDKAAGYIYAQSYGTALMTFTPAGVQEKSFKLGMKQGEETEQMLVHPSGRRVLVLAGTSLVWLDLSG